MDLSYTHYMCRYGAAKPHLYTSDLSYTSTASLAPLVNHTLYATDMDIHFSCGREGKGRDYIPSVPRHHLV